MEETMYTEAVEDVVANDKKIGEGVVAAVHQVN